MCVITFEIMYLRALASTLSFEALSKPFLDRLDIFSDATNVTNTAVLFKWKLCTGKADSAPTNADKS